MAVNAWRLRWETANGYDEMTEWSDHYDIIREMYDEKRKERPGANVTMEHLRIDMSTPEPSYEVREMSFGGGA